MLAPSVALTDEPSIRDHLVDVGGFSIKKIESIGDSVLVREIDVPNASREAGFAGLIRIQSTGDALVRALAKRDVAVLGDTQAAGFFSDPAKASDVDRLTFSDSDFEVLAECHVGDCKFKLGEAGIERIESIDWKAPGAKKTVTDLFRREAVSYVNAYREQGDAALIVYDDKKQPVALAKTFEDLLTQFVAFERVAPKFVSSLSTYPKGERSGTAAALDWSVRDFGRRPTLTIDQLVVDVEPEDANLDLLFASKTLYANHYVAARIQMGAVIEGDKALGVPGRYMLLVDRIVFDDDLNGFKRALLGRGLSSDLEDRMKGLRRLADGGR